MMVEDRFTMILDYDDEIGLKENNSGDVIVLKHKDENSINFVTQLCHFLNEQHLFIEQLIKDEKYWEEKAMKRLEELERENEMLRVINAKNELYIKRVESRGRWTNNAM